MNQIENLSNNLTQLTTEIKTYQNIGGQAIFEIGRRLKWVKEHDLAHGEFGKWLEDVNISNSQAHRFMKVVDDFPNLPTSANIGINVLYEIATMPEEERDKPQQLSSGEVKKPDEMTVRELREVKAQLKDKDEQISSKDKTIESLLNRKPEVVEKEVEVEKIPDDYDLLKGKVGSMESINERYMNENAELREALKKRQEAMKNSGADSNSLQQEVDELEQQISSLHEVKSLDERINSFISDMAVYGQTTDFNGIAIKQETMDHVISSLSVAKKMIEDIEKNITSDKIINADGLD